VPLASVSKCSKMHVADLLNHLAGAGKHRGRHVQAERLGGLQVDHKLVFGRRLHRQVKRSHPHGVKHAFLHGGRLGRIGDALLHMACLGRATELFVRGILLARRLSILYAGRLRVFLALRHEALECGTRELLFGRFRLAARKRRS